MSEAIGIIGIVPVSEEDRHGIPYRVQPGMVHHKCEKCGTLGWIGPRSISMKSHSPEIPIWCMNCIMAESGGEDLSVHSLGGN